MKGLAAARVVLPWFCLIMTLLLKTSVLDATTNSTPHRKRQPSSSRSQVVRPQQGVSNQKRIANYPKCPRLAWPIKRDSFWISSYYGRRSRKRLHKGIDLAALHGTPVYAASDGLVKEARLAGTYGNMILLAHDTIFQTRYAHLHRIYVRPGMRIAQGRLIGRVGRTGRVTGKNGEHLHFELLAHNRPINPIRFLA